MKLGINELKDICESYGILGENQKKLIDEFLHEYSDADLIERNHENAVFGRTSHYYVGDKLVLYFSSSLHPLFSDEDWGIPGYAELFGKGFVHRFYDNGTDKLLRKEPQKSEQTISADKEAVSKKRTHGKLADLVENVFSSHQNG